jgi:hypothetical protein
MSPTVFRYKDYRFFFFSREEERVHIHVSCPAGGAKFWVEPIVSLIQHYGLSAKELRELQKVVEEHKNEIIRAWKKHFVR